MGIFGSAAGPGLTALVCAAAAAQAPIEYSTLKLRDLQSLVERGGLRVVATEPASIMVSDGKGSPARLSMAACDRARTCRIVQIYTRYVIGGSEKGMEAANLFSLNYPSARMMLVMAAGEPAVDVGRDASLEGGRTEDEIIGEIATAINDARLLRDRLMASDPTLRARLGQGAS